jgi:hypothetical protein
MLVLCDVTGSPTSQASHLRAVRCGKDEFCPHTLCDAREPVVMGVRFQVETIITLLFTQRILRLQKK